jgi:hypothetical protein
MTATYACSACPVCSCAQRNAEQIYAVLKNSYPAGAERDTGGFTAQGSPQAEGVTGVPGTLGMMIQDGPGVRATAQPKERSFTRAEVLAVISAEKARILVPSAHQGALATLDMLGTIFERME